MGTFEIKNFAGSNIRNDIRWKGKKIEKLPTISVSKTNWIALRKSLYVTRAFEMYVVLFIQDRIISLQWHNQVVSGLAAGLPTAVVGSDYVVLDAG